MSLSAFVDASKTSLFLSLGSIAFSPAMWNIVARNGKSSVISAPSITDPDLRYLQKEYRNKTLTHIFCGNAYMGCYFLAVCIFSSSRLRDHLYVVRVVSQYRPLTHTLHTHTYVHTQLPNRDPRTAACLLAPRSARHAYPRRALRPRADLRPDLELGTRHHGQIHGRLFRHPYGFPRRGLPVQRAPGSDVRREHDELCCDGSVVRGVPCFELLLRRTLGYGPLTFYSFAGTSAPSVC
jgi:hypothetical protein